MAKPCRINLLPHQQFVTKLLRFYLKKQIKHAFVFLQFNFYFFLLLQRRQIYQKSRSRNLPKIVELEFFKACQQPRRIFFFKNRTRSIYFQQKHTCQSWQDFLVEMMIILRIPRRSDRTFRRLQPYDLHDLQGCSPTLVTFIIQISRLFSQ